MILAGIVRVVFVTDNLSGGAPGGKDALMCTNNKIARYKLFQKYVLSWKAIKSSDNANEILAHWEERVTLSRQDRKPILQTKCYILSIKYHRTNLFK